MASTLTALQAIAFITVAMLRTQSPWIDMMYEASKDISGKKVSIALSLSLSLVPRLRAESAAR